MKLPSPTARLPEQRRLMGRRNDYQLMTLVAALIQALCFQRKPHDIVLRILQLQIVHKKAPVDRTGVEQKLVGRDGEQGLRHLRYAGEGEVLDILAGHDEAGVLLPAPLEHPADVFDGCRVGKPHVKLVQHRHGVALGQHPVAEEGEDVEQQRAPEILRCIRQVLHADTRNRSDVTLVYPLKNLLSAPLHREWSPRRISCSNSAG